MSGSWLSQNNCYSPWWCFNAENCRTMAHMRHYRTNEIKVKTCIIPVTTLWMSGISAIGFQMDQDTKSTFVRVFPPFHPPPWVIRCFTNMVRMCLSKQALTGNAVLTKQEIQHALQWKLHKPKYQFAFPDDRTLIFWTALFNKLLVLLLLWFSSWSFSEARAASNAVCPSVWSFLRRRPQKTTIFLGFE